MDSGMSGNRTSDYRPQDDDTQPRLPALIEGDRVPQPDEYPTSNSFCPFTGPYPSNDYDFDPTFQDAILSLYNENDSAYMTSSIPDRTKYSTSTYTGQSFDPYSHARPSQTTSSYSVPAAFPSFGDGTQTTTGFSPNLGNIPRMPGPWDPNFTPNPAANGKRAISLETGDSADGQHGAKLPKLSSSNLIEATVDQEALMLPLLTQCEEQIRLPIEKELKALAILTKLPVHKVTLWFGDKLRLMPKTHQHCNNESTEPDSEVIRNITNYINIAKVKWCSTVHSRKSAGGRYLCTAGCGYSTNSRDAWERHEEKKQPQQFWHCVACRSRQKNGEIPAPFITHRCDKFREHAKNCHGSQNAEDLRERSRVPFNAPLDRYCTYKPRATGKPCGYYFGSWRERNDHYVQHYNEALEDDDGKPFDNRDSSDDDDDDDDDDDEPRRYTGSFTGKSNSPTVSGIPPGSSGHQKRQNGGNQGGQTAGTSNQKRKRYNGNNFDDVCEDSAIEMTSEQAGRNTVPSNRNYIRQNDNCLHDLDQGSAARECSNNYHSTLSDQNEQAARWLIHVEDYHIDEVKRKDRYLALKYPTLMGSKLPTHEFRQGPSCLSLPPFSELPPLFQKALHLTKEMGFQYLWIDKFCGSDGVIGVADLVYRQANLILVVGCTRQSTDQIWHFTCDYTHLNTVESWTKQSVSFHHLQQLGHGAYSVVDKVELRPTNETFARKIVFRTTTKRSARPSFLREIEIMQKCRHPHIARFVAAYYDRSALNILMSPVADCDLRQFLSSPDQFPEQHKYLEEWFVSLAEALAYMHGLRCRHKDVKPANILISRNKVLLTDFGTSYDFSTTDSSTSGGAFMTPKYCAPEVAAHGDRGRSADVWSLGCVFAEMITVAVGRSLEDMHGWLQMDEESTDCDATYHKHLEGLRSWLGQLSLLHLTEAEKRVLRITLNMLEKNQKKRPKAIEVHTSLCSKQECNSVGSETACHCCPHESSTATATPTQDSGSGNMLSLIPMCPIIPVQQRETFLTLAISYKTKLTGPVAFVFVFRTNTTKLWNGCPFLKWINLVERFKPKIWEQEYCNLMKDSERSESLQDSVCKESSSAKNIPDTGKVKELGDVESCLRKEESLDAVSCSNHGHVRRGIWSSDQARHLRKELKALAWRGSDTACIVDAESQAVYDKVVAKYGRDVEQIAMAPI